MKVSVSIDSQSYTVKPKGVECGGIKKRAAQRWSVIDLEDFADRVGNQGYSFVPAHLVGGEKADNFTEIQVIAIDFDGGIKPQEVQQRCEEMDLGLCFMYHTLSYVEGQNEKFRAVFILENLLRDSFLAKIIIRMLMVLFPESDKACKDLNRLFLGGKELFYFNEDARLNLVSLFISVKTVFYQNKDFKHNIRGFGKECGIFLYDNLPAFGPILMLEPLIEKIQSKIDENATVNIINYIHKFPVENSSIFAIKGIPDIYISNTRFPRAGTKKTRMHLDICGSYEHCFLLKEFMEGTRNINHVEKFGILLNLRQIRGGEKLFKNTIEKYESEQTVEKWSVVLKDCKHYDYNKPMFCRNFCPYCADCPCQGTILQALRLNHKIITKTPPEYVSLEEAYSQLQDNLRAALASPEEGIHLIRAQTGLGKTKAYIDEVVLHPNSGFVIAVPTNKLKNEIYERLRRQEVPEEQIFVTPSIRGNPFVPDMTQQRILMEHERGRHDQTKAILEELIHEKDGRGMGKAQKEELMRIITGMNAYQGERIIVTTHKYFFYISETVKYQKTVIVDEDILKQIFNDTYSVSIEELEAVASAGIKGHSDIAKVMLNSPAEKYMKLEKMRFDDLTVEESEKIETKMRFEGNVYDLHLARSFVRHDEKVTGRDEVRYFCPSWFRSKKIIVMSATLNPDIYAAYFVSMKIHTYPEKKARYKGKLVQYSYHSLGRRDLSNKLEAFAFASAFFNGKSPDYISFKYLNNIEVNKNLPRLSLHFGNTMGIDELAGHDFAVIGTAFMHEDADKLIGVYLGADVNNEENRQPERRRIDYGSFNFVLSVYEDLLLRKIQLYGIESEMEQAVGRARLLRNDCTVLVLSAFPCDGAEFRTEDYLEEYRKK